MRYTGLSGSVNPLDNRDIDSRFDKVEIVANHIEEISAVGDNVATIKVVADNIDEVVEVVEAARNIKDLKVFVNMLDTADSPTAVLAGDVLTLGIPRGETGEAGDDGRDGLSAYQIWLNSGKIGSESSFLLDIKGEKGNNGLGINNVRFEYAISDINGAQYPDIPAGRLGYTDVYHIYADDGNTIKLGEFKVRNATEAYQPDPEEIKKVYESNDDTNAFTDADKAKVDSAEDATQLDARDTANRDRANHTGTQAMDTLTETDELKILTAEERDKLNNIEMGATDDQTASEVPFSPAGDITSTDTQAAVVEVDGKIDSTATTLRGEIATVQGNVDTLDTEKLDLTGGTISGDITITGNLTVSGHTATVETGTVTTSDNVVIFNDGEVGAGVTAGEAGIEIDRGTEDNFSIKFVEATDDLRIGIGTSLKAVPVLSAGIVDDGIVTWDATNKELVSSKDISVDSVTVSGTVDGRDISVDGAALDQAVIDIATKANQSDLDTLTTTVGNKADQTDLDTLSGRVDNKAEQSALNALTTTVNGKADQTALDTLSTSVDGKAEQSALDAAIALINGKADQDDLDDKADITAVNDALALKANTAEVNTALDLKADKTELADIEASAVAFAIALG